MKADRVLPRGKLSAGLKRMLSVRSLLTPQQLKFCQLYVTSEGRNATPLYRQVFAAEAKKQTTQQQYDAVAMLLADESIQAYIKELQLPTKDVARLVLAEQIHTEMNPDVARRAAQQILNDDDSEQFRDSVERFWAVTAEVGAEIEIPLPGRCQSERIVRCTCGEEIAVVCGAPYGVRAPVSDLFRERPSLEATPSEN